VCSIIPVLGVVEGLLHIAVERYSSPAFPLKREKKAQQLGLTHRRVLGMDFVARPCIWQSESVDLVLAGDRIR